MIPNIIISGGQTGADQGGLFAAEILKIKTGGYAPKGYRTETEQATWLHTRFRLDEHTSDTYDYEPRTRANVEWADATAIFGRRSRGSNLTERICQLEGKPYIWIQPRNNDGAHHRFRLWLIRSHPQVLNIAGNRESVNPGICAATRDFIVAVLSAP